MVSKKSSEPLPVIFDPFFSPDGRVGLDSPGAIDAIVSGLIEEEMEDLGFGENLCSLVTIIPE